MDFLIKNTNNKMCKADSESNASHVMMNIEEYTSIMNQLENLKRINRERSNSERGLKPKKERSGYVLLGYATNNFRMNFGKDSNSYECRRLLLETTYDVRFNYKDALSQVIEDMTTLSESFGASICIDKNSIMDKEMFESFFQKDSGNVLFVHGLEAQRDGFWAVRLYANYTPDVPADCIKETTNNKER